MIDDVLRYNRRHRHGCRRRARPLNTSHGLRFLLGNTRILSSGMLGVERQRLGVQVRRARLRRRRTRRGRLRLHRSRLLDGARKAPGEDDAQLPPSQRLSDHPRHGPAVVWMAGVQRRICLRRQPSRGHGLLELMLDCDGGSRDLGSPRLPPRT